MNIILRSGRRTWPAGQTTQKITGDMAGTVIEAEVRRQQSSDRKVLSKILIEAVTETQGTLHGVIIR